MKTSKISAILSLSLIALLIFMAPAAHAQYLGPWTATTTYPLLISNQQCVMPPAGGYIYCVGGYNGGGGVGYDNAVYSATATSGAVGGWVAQGNYPTNVAYHSCVADNSYIYCVGGYTGSANLASVYSASITAGTVGSWTATTSYPTSITTHSCGLTGGYIVCVGGQAGVGLVFTAAVYSASASGGVVGAWTLSANPYPEVIVQTSCVSLSGYITCVGGDSPIPGLVKDVYSSLVSVGVVGAWVSQTQYDFFVAAQSCVSEVTGNDIYCIGGESPSTFAVRGATLTTGTVGAWNGDVQPYPVPIEQQSCVEAEDLGESTPDSATYVYCIGGQMSGAYTNIVRSALLASSAPPITSPTVTERFTCTPGTPNSWSANGICAVIGTLNGIPNTPLGSTPTLANGQAVFFNATADINTVVFFTTSVGGEQSQGITMFVFKISGYTAGVMYNAPSQTQQLDMITAITNEVVSIIANIAAAIAVLIMALWVIKVKFHVASNRFTVLLIALVVFGEGHIGLIPPWIGDFTLVITIVFILYTRSRATTHVDEAAG